MEPYYRRILIALPFLAASVGAFMAIHLNGLLEVLEETAEMKTIEWGNISVPILEKFHHIQFLDDWWRPVSFVFAPSTFAFDPVAWWQMLSFLPDVSLLYSLWLFEAVRNVSPGYLTQFPLLVGFPTQRLGIGVCAPLYYFFHYINSPPDSKVLRKTDTSYTGTVFFTMVAFSYVPVFLMYLGPTLNIRHFWTWAWQMFPVWVSISQIILAKVRPAGTKKKDLIQQNNPNSDIATIRATIGVFSAISAIIWICLLTNAPYSLATIFIPKPISPENYTLLPVTRRFLQSDHVWAFGSTFMWLGYVFADLKRAGMIQKSWVLILTLGILVTACFGPGVAIGGAWLWREEVLSKRDSNPAHPKSA